MNKLPMVSKVPMQLHWVDRVPIMVILALLIFIIFAHTGESVYGQMSRLGQYFWDDYLVLRSDIDTPTCNPNFDIDARLDELAASHGKDDDFDLFSNEFDRDLARTSLLAQQSICVKEHAMAKQYAEQITPGVILFRNIEDFFSNASVYTVSQQKNILMLLLFFAASIATLKKHHISFRPMVSRLDHQVSIGAQLVANSMFAVSALAYHRTAFSSGIQVDEPVLVNGIVVGSVALALVSLWQLFHIPKETESGGRVGRAILSIPLYTLLMLALVVKALSVQHIQGLAIYVTTFFDLSALYIDVALYLWCGMLIKQTQMGERVFSVLTPWRLPPEILAVTAILIMALPTAYTGASSIIILAMGAVVYRELRRVGTRRQLALAASAMSGSCGIVLRPCLLIVLISILNKEVVTDDLFYWGIRVFIVTLAVFLAYALLTKKDPFRVASFDEAFSPSLENFKCLLPYILTFLVVIALYDIFLGAQMDQFSAPIMLPVLLIAVIIYERKFSNMLPIHVDPERMDQVGASLTKSMLDASVQIGALLLLMATFCMTTGFALGSDTSSFDFIGSFDSRWATMALLVCVFVVIGMFVESMAAVAAVSLVIAPIAYQQGINPIHFWMTCLVALELGYLSPPVALSHIFTRQVVGEEECIAAAKEGDTFYYRHERLILPLLVMSTTLMIVAFVPLALGV